MSVPTDFVAPERRGFTFSHLQTVKFRGCYPPHLTRECVTQGPGAPDHQVSHINSVVRTPAFAFGVASAIGQEFSNGSVLGLRINGQYPFGAQMLGPKKAGHGVWGRPGGVMVP